MHKGIPVNSHSPLTQSHIYSSESIDYVRAYDPALLIVDDQEYSFEEIRAMRQGPTFASLQSEECTQEYNVTQCLDMLQEKLAAIDSLDDEIPRFCYTRNSEDQNPLNVMCCESGSLPTQANSQPCDGTTLSRECVYPNCNITLQPHSENKENIVLNNASQSRALPQTPLQAISASVGGHGTLDDTDTTTNLNLTSMFAKFLDSTGPLPQTEAVNSSLAEPTSFSMYIDVDELNLTEDFEALTLSSILQSKRNQPLEQQQPAASLIKTKPPCAHEVHSLKPQPIITTDFVEPLERSHFEKLLSLLPPLTENVVSYQPAKEPTVTQKKSLTEMYFGGDPKYEVRQLAEGGFAKIFKAKSCATGQLSVLKIQDNSSSQWEFYISQQISERIMKELQFGFGRFTQLHLFSQRSCLEMSYAEDGSLQVYLVVHAKP